MKTEHLIYLEAGIAGAIVGIFTRLFDLGWFSGTSFNPIGALTNIVLVLIVAYGVFIFNEDKL